MSRRPTPEKLVEYAEAWEEESSKDPLLAGRAGMGDLFREMAFASYFLADVLREMGAPTNLIRDCQFTFGRLCVGRDPWVAFDSFLPKCEEAARQLTQRKEWARVPVPQDVPAPTKLLTDWLAYARRSVGEQGVFPLPFFHRTSGDEWTIEALAISGGDAMKHAADVLRTKRPAEFVLGIDMQAAAGQDLEFDDFLAVVWYVDGRFVTGVVDYQKTTDVPDGEAPAFHEINWHNNYWNHSLREMPVADMLKALGTHEARQEGASPADG